MPTTIDTSTFHPDKLTHVLCYPADFLTRLSPALTTPAPPHAPHPADTPTLSFGTWLVVGAATLAIVAAGIAFRRGRLGRRRRYDRWPTPNPQTPPRALRSSSAASASVAITPTQGDAGYDYSQSSGYGDGGDDVARSLADALLLAEAASSPMAAKLPPSPLLADPKGFKQWLNQNVYR